MKNRRLRILVLFFSALILFMPSKYSNAQKLISETLKSKTLVEESDGFKWYRYLHEYQVKYKGSIITFTRESAYNLNDRLLIDGAFNIDWIRSDLERSWIKKRYKKYPSKIKEEYSLILEYSPSHGLFAAQKDANGKSILGTFSKDGGCLTYHGQLKDDGVIVGDRIYDFSDNADNTGGSRLTFRKEKYHGYGVMKNGIIIVPFKDYFYMKSEKGIYIGCRYGQKQEKYTDLYTSDGKHIGELKGAIEVGEYEIFLKFFEGPNNEKWLNFYQGYPGKGYYYCLDSGRKIEYSEGSLSNHRIVGDCLVFGNHKKEYLYSGDGVKIGDVSYDHIGYSGYNGVFLVHNNFKYGAIRVKGDNVKVIVNCNMGLRYDGNSDLASLGLFQFSTGEPYYSLVVDSEGKEIVPLGNYYLAKFNKKDNTFSCYKKIGNDVYEVIFNLKGEELSSKYLYTKNNPSPNPPTPTPPTPNPPSPNPPTPDPPSPNPPKREPVPVQVWKPCGMCGGSGTCYMCNGTGGYYFGPNAKWLECTACHGLKRCTYCAGQGGHYEVEYR